MIKPIIFPITVFTLLLMLIAGHALATGPSGIVYDAEFQKVFKQHADKWAEEDKQIERKLEALRKKHGKQPLIIKLTFYRRFRTKKSDLNTSNNTLLSCKPLIIGSNDKRILETIY